MTKLQFHVARQRFVVVAEWNWRIVDPWDRKLFNGSLGHAKEEYNSDITTKIK